MTFGPHMTPPIDCQKYADSLLQAIGNQEQFYELAIDAICTLGPSISAESARKIAYNMRSSSADDPYEWRRNVAMTLARIRDGWGAE